MSRYLIIIALIIVATRIQSQEQPPTVPDLTGLTVPDAAAVLNRSGLELGAQQIIEWDESQPANTISAQSPAAGSEIIPGMNVSVTVMRPLNVRLVYDDNDFTLINLTGDVLNLSFISFNGQNTTFAGRRWDRVPMLPVTECVQVWSVARTAGKDVTGCSSLEQWMTTNNRGEHFWTSGDFTVLQDGLERGTCESVEAPGVVVECSIYLAPGTIPEDMSEYMYFTYTPDQFLIINRSEGRWLPAMTIRLAGEFIPGDSVHFDNVDAIIGDITYLAPGQCLLFGNGDSSPVEACDVIARATLTPSEFFWREPFRVRRGAGREDCPAAVSGERSICLLPR